MDISLREWLIIGGVLIVILILVDGWRRVSANRSRLRLEIDRTLSELSDDDPNNPELPNGGARMRGGQAADERIEPGFAEVDDGAEPDPLFDDIPAVTSDGRRPSAKQAPVSTPRVPADPVSPELKPQDAPIPVLLDEVESASETGGARRHEAAEQPFEPDDPPRVEQSYRDALSAETQLEHPVADDRLTAAEAVEPRHGEREHCRAEPDAAEAVEPAVSEIEPEAEPKLQPELEPEPTLEPVPEPAPAPQSTPVRSNRGLKHTPDPEHVLVITVVGRQGAYLPGPALNRVVTACGMEWGDMDIYHRPEDSRPDAPIQFSMANAVAPGTFDPDNLEALETPAVTFFMSMDEPTDTMTAYECMLATAETLAKHLNGDLLDEDRSVMRPQTKEHYRERIRDFEMHQRQRRAN